MAYSPTTREVTFGNKLAAFAGMTVAANGTLTFEAPESFTGMVSSEIETEQEQNPVYADDQIHLTLNGEEVTEGTISVLQFPKKFLEHHLGKKVTAAGGLTNTGQYKNFAFQWIETVVDEFGAETLELHILYNVKAAAPSSTTETKADGVEAKVFEIPITVLPNSRVLDEDDEPVKEYILRRTDANADLFDEAFDRILLPTDVVGTP